METKMFALGEVKAAEDDDSPNGAFDVILSAPTLDRDGEVIDAKVFEPLPEHITFDIDHGMSTATTVGSGVPFYDGDVLRVKGTYSSIPRAQEVRTLVREGHIRTTSVAFMSAKREEDEDGVTHITKAELLNGAFVPIPSNRDALVLSAKAHDAKVAAAPDPDPFQYTMGDQPYTTLKGHWTSTTVNGLTTFNPTALCAKCAAPIDSATPAPVTPDPAATESGKSPASTVVAAARLRARHALLEIPR